MLSRPSRTRQFTLLAAVFHLHLLAVGLAAQPMFTFLRTVLSESELPVVTWLFPIGTAASFLLSRRFDQVILRYVPATLMVGELLLAAGYFGLQFHASSMDKGSSSVFDFAIIAAFSFQIGFFSTLSWMILTTTALRTVPNHYHKLRALASSGSTPTSVFHWRPPGIRHCCSR